jgi:hypothetical protein
MKGSYTEAAPDFNDYSVYTGFHLSVKSLY